MSEINYHWVVWDAEKIKRFWDYETKIKDYQEGWFSKLCGDGIWNFSKRYLQDKSDFTIFDYGAGRGFFIEAVMQKSSKVKSELGEYSSEGLAELTEKFKNEPRVLGAYDLNTTPNNDIKEGTYDAAFLIEVIEHLDDDFLDTTLTELNRIIKSGGKVIVTTPFDENLKSREVCCPDCGAIFHRVQHMRSWNIETITVAMQKHGFESKLVTNTNFHIYKKGSFSTNIKNFLKRNFFYNRVKRDHLIYIGTKP